MSSSYLCHTRTDPDYKGNVVSNASFAKVFGPGCRLGWLEAPERLKEIILASGTSASAGGFNHCMSGVIGSVISLGFLKEMLTLERSAYRVSVLDYIINKSKV